MYKPVRKFFPAFKNLLNMATMKFKTNAKCGGCVAAIGAKLNKIMAPDDWSITLTDPGKTLEVTADIPAEKVIEAVKEAGFKVEQVQ